MKTVVAGLLAGTILPVCSQSLTQRWSNVISDSAYVNMEGKMVRTGPDGHIITACNGTQANTTDDIVVIKSDASTGAKIWQRNTGSPAGFGDFVSGMAVDGKGDVIVVGGRNDLGIYKPSFLAAKFSGADGTLLWQRVFRANLNDYFVGVAVDSKNDVIAVGSTRTTDYSPISSDVFTCKLASATGETVWQNQFTSPLSSSTTTDAPRAVALDAAGNIYVTGYGQNRGSIEALTFKLAATDGSLLWNHIRSDSRTNGSSGEDIAVDAAGDVLVACSTTQGRAGLRVVKYKGADGSQLWENLRDTSIDFPNSLGIDPSGNVVVTGYTDNGTGNDVLTQKISGDTGTTLWTRIYDGGIVSSGIIKDDSGAAVRFDTAGNPVVAGSSNSASANGPDTMVFKLSSADGTPLVQQRIAVHAGEDFPMTRDSLVVGPGHITVSGRTYATGGTNRAFVFRLNDPAAPQVVTRAAAQVTAASAQVGAVVNPYGSTTNLRYVYGTSADALGQTTADKAMGNGFALVENSDTLTGLQPATTYFYQARATGGSLTGQGEILQFTTPSNDATLASLGVGTGTLNPSFSPATSDYTITLPPAPASLSLTPATTHPAATLTVNGTPHASGTATPPLQLPIGNTTLTTQVTAEDGTTRRTYTVTATRMPDKFAFVTATEVPVRAPGFSASGVIPDISLGFAPPTGTNLTLVDNTGVAAIRGRFSNLAQGQVVVLTHNNARYKFVVNYHGGTGNDLVLEWAHNRIYAWGYNTYYQLGVGPLPNRSNLPLPVGMTGPIAGKTITDVAAGFEFSLALCSDGTLFTWGENGMGQLGDGTYTDRTTPVPVIMTGAFAGKTPVAITAGARHSMVLCSDGTLVSWGRNLYGELGTGAIRNNTNVPIIVPRTGTFATKVVTAISAGFDHNLALCEDGTLFGWGNNSSGELGYVGTTNSVVPFPVNATGALAGKKVTLITAGAASSLVACSDGTLIAWGVNSEGELGNGSTTPYSTPNPTQVPVTNAIAGKTFTAISAADDHRLVLCSDGTMAAWGGDNRYGELGNGTTVRSYAPVPVRIQDLLSGKKITHLSANINHSHALCSDGTLASWGYAYNLGNDATTDSSVPVAATIPPGVKFVNMARGPKASHNLVVGALPLSDDSTLSGLATTAGPLDTVFSPARTSYLATSDSGMTSATVTPASANPDAIITVNGTPVASGTASQPIALVPGNNELVIRVTAETGTSTVYTLTITRPPLRAVFDSVASVPLTATGYSATGNTADFTLGFAPAPGTILTVINVTDPALIDGQFTNLAQGQHVGLVHAGITYDFVANYHGGTGNDLVLQWAATELHAWGANNQGQLGDGSTTGRLTPVAVDDSGVLAGKTIISAGTGYLHSLALASDGTLASWGHNIYRQLGNGAVMTATTPVAVENSTGALAGRTVIAISVGPFHNLALCSDGKIAAWGYNNHGQLGTGDRDNRGTPALVNSSGVLAGKQVVGIATGIYQSFALCSDGTVMAWGYNDEGELGDNSTTTRLTPVAVHASGALAGKKVVSISAGQYHTLALCTDGTLVSWGYNKHGELGDGAIFSSQVPVAIGSSGVLAGRTVSAISAGGSHNLALCTDGTLAAWGFNNKTQIGSDGLVQTGTPFAIAATGAILGKTIVRISTGGAHNTVLCSDGSLAAWGDNLYGQLGNNSKTTTAIPSPAELSGLPAGSRLMWTVTGSASVHNLAIVGLPQTSSGLISQAIPLPSATGDSDQDGIPDLIERAFALDLVKDGAGALPQPQRIGDNHVIEFTAPAGLTGFTYGAEYSHTLQPGSWTPIPDTGSGLLHIFTVPADDTKPFFFRLKVTE